MSGIHSQERPQVVEAHGAALMMSIHGIVGTSPLTWWTADKDFTRVTPPGSEAASSVLILALQIIRTSTSLRLSIPLAMW